MSSAGMGGMCVCSVHACPSFTPFAQRCSGLPGFSDDDPLSLCLDTCTPRRPCCVCIGCDAQENRCTSRRSRPIRWIFAFLCAVFACSTSYRVWMCNMRHGIQDAALCSGFDGMGPWCLGRACSTSAMHATRYRQDNFMHIAHGILALAVACTRGRTG
jgi:hypothetical protein